MKKILFYTDTPSIGGTEKHMLLLAKHLSQKGYQISLAYGAYSKIHKMRSEFEKHCKTIYVLPAIHKHDPRHYTRLKKILKAGKFDLIHIHLWNSGAGRYAFFAGHHSGTPIITTEHDPFPLTKLKKKIKQNCLKKTSKTITISRDNYKFIKQEYGIADEKIKLIHNGIEISEYDKKPKTINLPIKKNGIIVTCIAELHPRKGHKYLLEAFRKLQIKTPNIHLMLVGTGQLEHSLKEKYGDIPNVHFLGWRKDIPSILSASDIFILPSLKEAFGLVILEAMASGVLVISSNTGGVPDIIDNGKTGFLIPPADTNAIVHTLLDVIGHPDKKARIQKAASIHIQKNFTAEQMAEKTIRIYSEIISNK